MTGLIWFVQIAHYPSFLTLNEESFPRYHSLHTRRTGYVVGPMMGFELLVAILLVLSARDGFEQNAAALLLVLLAVIWLSTVLLQVPLHNSLSRVFREETAAKLIRGNWLRTIAWSLRSAVLLLLAASVSLESL